MQQQTEAQQSFSRKPQGSDYSNLDFRGWYDPDTCQYLLNSVENKAKYIRVVFHEGEDRNTTEFKKQIAKLMELSKRLGRKAIFISKEPGDNNHYVCGMVDGETKKLLLMNPLGITEKEKCYQVLKELKEEGTLDQVYFSEDVLQVQQYDDEDQGLGLVSCGPISAEFAMHMLGGLEEQYLINFWENLPNQNDSNWKENHGLKYCPVKLGGLLPESLRNLEGQQDLELFQVKLDTYKARLQSVRSLHNYTLGRKNPSLDSPSQTIFNLATRDNKTISELWASEDYKNLQNELGLEEQRKAKDRLKSSRDANILRVSAPAAATPKTTTTTTTTTTQVSTSTQVPVIPITLTKSVGEARKKAEEARKEAEGSRMATLKSESLLKETEEFFQKNLLTSDNEKEVSIRLEKAYVARLKAKQEMHEAEEALYIVEEEVHKAKGMSEKVEELHKKMEMAAEKKVNAHKRVGETEEELKSAREAKRAVRKSKKTSTVNKAPIPASASSTPKTMTQVSMSASPPAKATPIKKIEAREGQSETKKDYGIYLRDIKEMPNGIKRVLLSFGDPANPEAFHRYELSVVPGTAKIESRKITVDEWKKLFLDVESPVNNTYEKTAMPFNTDEVNVEEVLGFLKNTSPFKEKLSEMQATKLTEEARQKAEEARKESEAQGKLVADAENILKQTEASFREAAGTENEIFLEASVDFCKTFIEMYKALQEKYKVKEEMHKHQAGNRAEEAEVAFKKMEEIDKRIISVESKIGEIKQKIDSITETKIKKMDQSITKTLEAEELADEWKAMKVKLAVNTEKLKASRALINAHYAQNKQSPSSVAKTPEETQKKIDQLFTKKETTLPPVDIEFEKLKMGPLEEMVEVHEPAVAVPPEEQNLTPEKKAVGVPETTVNIYTKEKSRNIYVCIKSARSEKWYKVDDEGILSALWERPEATKATKNEKDIEKKTFELGQAISIENDNIFQILSKTKQSETVKAINEKMIAIKPSLGKLQAQPLTAELGDLADEVSAEQANSVQAELAALEISAEETKKILSDVTRQEEVRKAEEAQKAEEVRRAEAISKAEEARKKIKEANNKAGIYAKQATEETAYSEDSENKYRKEMGITAKAFWKAKAEYHKAKHGHFSAQQAMCEKQEEMHKAEAEMYGYEADGAVKEAEAARKKMEEASLAVEKAKEEVEKMSKEVTEKANGMAVALVTTHTEAARKAEVARKEMEAANNEAKKWAGWAASAELLFKDVEKSLQAEADPLHKIVLIARLGYEKANVVHRKANQAMYEARAKMHEAEAELYEHEANGNLKGAEVARAKMEAARLEVEKAKEEVKRTGEVVTLADKEVNDAWKVVNEAKALKNAKERLFALDQLILQLDLIPYVEDSAFMRTAVDSVKEALIKLRNQLAAEYRTKFPEQRDTFADRDELCADETLGEAKNFIAKIRGKALEKSQEFINSCFVVIQNNLPNTPELRKKREQLLEIMTRAVQIEKVRLAERQAKLDAASNKIKQLSAYIVLFDAIASSMPEGDIKTAVKIVKDELIYTYSQVARHYRTTFPEDTSGVFGFNPDNNFSEMDDVKKNGYLNKYPTLFGKYEQSLDLIKGFFGEGFPPEVENRSGELEEMIKSALLQESQKQQHEKKMQESLQEQEKLKAELAHEEKMEAYREEQTRLAAELTHETKMRTRRDEKARLEAEERQLTEETAKFEEARRSRIEEEEIEVEAEREAKKELKKLEADKIKMLTDMSMKGPKESKWKIMELFNKDGWKCERIPHTRQFEITHEGDKGFFAKMMSTLRGEETPKIHYDESNGAFSTPLALEEDEMMAHIELVIHACARACENGTKPAVVYCENQDPLFVDKIKEKCRDLYPRMKISVTHDKKEFNKAPLAPGKTKSKLDEPEEDEEVEDDSVYRKKFGKKG